MKFTLIFKTHESYDHSFGLVFVPCPCFVIGEKIILNLNPEIPYYQIGSIKRLLDETDIAFNFASGNRECILIIHNVGNGTEEDLKALVEDLKQESFSVQTVGFKV